MKNNLDNIGNDIIFASSVEDKLKKKILQKRIFLWNNTRRRHTGRRDKTADGVEIYMLFC